MMKLQVHAATDEAHLKHGATPSRSRNRHLHRVRTIFGCPEISATPSPKATPYKNGAEFESVERYLGADLPGTRLLDFGLDDVPVDIVAEVWMRHKHRFPRIDPRASFTLPRFVPVTT